MFEVVFGDRAEVGCILREDGLKFIFNLLKVKRPESSMICW